MQCMPVSAHGAADVDCPSDWGCLMSLKLVLQALNWQATVRQCYLASS